MDKNMSDNLKLYTKLYAVMNDSEKIEKNMTVGKGGNAYKAVSEAEILNMIKPLFKKYQLIIFPISGEIQDHCMVWDKTYNGQATPTLRAMTELKVMYRIVDTASGEFQDVVGFGNGSDPQDKGAGKAFTYSFKNVLSKTFMLFSGEDTDNTHSDDIGNQPQNNPPQQYPQSTNEKREQTLKEFSELLFQKGVTIESILKKASKATGKNISDIKYIKGALIEEYTKGLEQMPDVS